MSGSCRESELERVSSTGPSKKSYESVDIPKTADIGDRGADRAKASPAGAARPGTVPADFDPLDAARLFFASRTGGQSVWLVGGRVRDALLGRTSLDTDLAVTSGALKLAADLADASGGSFVALDRSREIARVVWQLDGPPSDLRPGLDARERSLDIKSLDGGDLTSDLAARDLTINAFALPLFEAIEPGVVPSRSAVIDHHGGLADLDARTIRMLSPGAFDADPLRLLRAPRIAIEIGFQIEPATRSMIRAKADLVAAPAAERVRDEVLRLLASKDPIRAINLLTELSLTPIVLPELAEASERPYGSRRGPRALEVAKSALRCAMSMEAQIALDHVQSSDELSESLQEILGTDLSVIAEHLFGLSFEGRPKALWLRLAALLSVTARSSCARYDHREGGWVIPDRPDLLRRSVLSTAGRLRLSAAAAEWLAAVVVYSGSPARFAGDNQATSQLTRAAFRVNRRSGGRGLDAALIAILICAAERSYALRGGSAYDDADISNLMPALILSLSRDERIAAAIAALARAGQGAARDRDSAPDDSMIDGKGLIESLGLQPGPVVGRLLEHIAAERAVGVLRDRDAALALARTLLYAERATV